MTLSIASHDQILDEYVDIPRYVREIDDNVAMGNATRALLRRYNPDRAKTLSIELDADSPEPLVLIAPSGTGKTTELRNQARRMRSLGKPAVFSEALGIVALSGQMELEQEDESALAHALSSGERAVLIVDGLDELHLHQRTIDELFRRLWRRINFLAVPFRLVFTARNGAWNAATARELKRQLKRLGQSEPKLITFEPLDDVAIQRLAVHYKVGDCRQFMADFRREEIDDLLDLRPADVRLLVDLSKQSGAMRKWTRVLNDYIDSSFAEERLGRSHFKALPPFEARAGLLRVAAAAMLMKLPHVGMPTVGLADGAVSSTRLFSDWPTGKLGELLENPLFVHKGRQAEAVQLPQGRISDFLVAQWFAARAERGLSAESLRDHLLVKVPWSEGYFIPQAHKPVVGWLGSEVPAFRRLLIGYHPAIVLYEGDPDHLPDNEIIEALRRLCEQISDGLWDGRPTNATVRRLARPSLEREIASLIAKYAKSSGVTAQLLTWVEQGKYGSCADLALSLARSAADPEVRLLAIRASTAAAPSRWPDLVGLLKDENEYVRSVLLKALLPEHLTGQALTEFLCAGGGHFMRNELRDMSGGISTQDLDAALSAMLPALCDPTVTAKTGAIFSVAVPLVTARLARGAKLEVAFDALAAIEHLHHGQPDMFLMDSEIRDLDQLVSADSNMRHALWMVRFRDATHDTLALGRLTSPSFGNIQANDLEWLWTSARPLVSDRLADMVLDRIWCQISVAERNRRLRESLPPDLVDHLSRVSSSQEQAERRRESEVATIAAKAEATRRENVRILAERRAAIEAGDDFHALEWAWNHLNGDSSDFSEVSAERLRKYVDDEYVQIFLGGLRAYWRKSDATLRRPGEGTPHGLAAALTGLSLDARAGLEFSSLSFDDARRAAVLAMHNMNSFPFWYAEVFRHHTDVARSVLQEQLVLEWDFESGAHGVLRFASHCERDVAECIHELVLGLFDIRVPAHPTTLRYAIDLLLTSESVRSRVIALVRQGVVASSPELPNAQWLRAWSHLDPEAAADWITKTATTTGRKGAFMTFLLETVALLEEDLSERFGRGVRTSLMAPRPLRRWCTLLLSLIKRSEDVRHHGVYSPGPRDQAQDLRNRLLTAVASNPTPEARDTLLRMREDPSLTKDRDAIDRLLAHQHDVAVEELTPTWTEDDILRIERMDEKLPRTLAELFALVQSHLQHVGSLIANADFSYRGLFSKETKEREIQLWVASCLHERARGLYSVVRENVVDDDKEVDISAFAPGVGQIPIEIKPLGPYSIAKLEDVMRKQLLGQYMLPPERRFGILLLVRRDKTNWHTEGKRLPLRSVETRLQKHANGLGLQFGKEIKVAVIDLLASPSKPTSTIVRNTPARSATSQGFTSAKKKAIRKRVPKRPKRKTYRLHAAVTPRVSTALPQRKGQRIAQLSKRRKAAVNRR